MKHKLAFFLAFLFPIACKPIQTSESVVKTENSSTEVFVKGLLSKPGSLARKRSGALLKEKLLIAMGQTLTQDHSINAQQASAALNAVLNEDSPDRISQRITIRAFKMTLDYLMADSTCSPSEKIRVYRGVGTLPVIRSTEMSRTRLVLFNRWVKGLIEELRQNGGLKGVKAFTGQVDSQGEPVVTGEDLGVKIFKSLGRFNKFSYESLPWFEIINLSWGFSTTRNLGLRWDTLTRMHSGDSRTSPLMSVTMLPEIASQFGPGYLTIDICPERALLVSPNLIAEWELYVPFFILPEEITGFSPKSQNCAIAQSPIGNEPKKFQGSCQKMPALRQGVTPMTAAYMNCFSPAGFPPPDIKAKTYRFDHKIFFEHSNDMDRKFYSVLAKSRNNQDWRKAASNLKNICKFDCADGKSVVSVINSVENDLISLDQKAPLPGGSRSKFYNGIAQKVRANCQLN